MIADEDTPLQFREVDYQDNDYFSEPVIKDEYAFKLYHDEGLPQNRKISCLNDDMFQVLFNNSEYLEFPAYLISLEFNKDFDYVLKNLELLNDQFNRDTYYDEGIKGDFLARLGEDLFSIESNNTEQLNRNITYLNKAEDDLNMRGDKLKFYRSASQISINNYKKRNHGFREAYLLKNSDGKLLTFRQQYLMIHVPFLNEKVYNGSRLSKRERFYFVMCTTDVELAKKQAKGDKIMEKLIKVSKEVENSNKILFKSYNHLAAEKELSREEEKLSIAKNLIKLKVPIQLIIEATKLSEKKIIELSNTIL